jgi:hypothetical protein
MLLFQNSSYVIPFLKIKQNLNNRLSDRLSPNCLLISDKSAGGLFPVAGNLSTSKNGGFLSVKNGL